MPFSDLKKHHNKNKNKTEVHGDGKEDNYVVGDGRHGRTRGQNAHEILEKSGLYADQEILPTSTTQGGRVSVCVPEKIAAAAAAANCR